MLPAVDTEYLQARGLAHEVRVADGITSVLLPNWPLPAGYTLPQATLLLRLSAGYRAMTYHLGVIPRKV